MAIAGVDTGSVRVQADLQPVIWLIGLGSAAAWRRFAFIK